MAHAHLRRHDRRAAPPHRHTERQLVALHIGRQPVHDQGQGHGRGRGVLHNRALDRGLGSHGPRARTRAHRGQARHRARLGGGGDVPTSGLRGHRPAHRHGAGHLLLPRQRHDHVVEPLRGRGGALREGRRAALPPRPLAARHRGQRRLVRHRGKARRLPPHRLGRLLRGGRARAHLLALQRGQPQLRGRLREDRERRGRPRPHLPPLHGRRPPRAPALPWRLGRRRLRGAGARVRPAVVPRRGKRPLAHGGPPRPGRARLRHRNRLRGGAGLLPRGGSNLLPPGRPVAPRRGGH